MSDNGITCYRRIDGNWVQVRQPHRARRHWLGHWFPAMFAAGFIASFVAVVLL